MGDVSVEWIVQNGDMVKVKEFFEKNSSEINSQVANGRTAMCMAADYGQADVIEYLISKGADVNLSDKYGITPLLAAIFEGHTSCVKYLLNQGAKKDGKAPDGSSYADCAEKQEIKDLLS